ncbi:MAG: extracellular solute-binding protein [Desulfobacterales bacterium]|jgi:multiple sugar transport system substrate-binding protein|nr:extracellular solute-binding protein [Desulfobacterales bacterium]
MTSALCLAAALCLFAVPVLHGTAAAAAVTFWTTEVERDRQQTQQQIALEFTRKTGIGVRVVPVEENLLAERVTAAYAAKSLPDVIFHPMEFTVGWCEAGILDSGSATEVIRALGEETFAAGPLKLARYGKEFAAVPADGWGQLLLYRKDLFAEKRLPAPDRWDLILSAAAALHNPPLLWGFEAATDPGQVYTQQVFEHLALSNGVKLASADGKVDLTTPEMIATLEFYRKLAAFTPPGNLYWLHTRMDYLSGRAAMIVWSPFILDELSGLRRDQPVVPDIATGAPGFLARSTGFIATIRGPNGSGQYGQANYFGITHDADRKSASAWVQFLMTEGYLRWLGMAAEGKLPVRRGTRERPRQFVDGWMQLEFGTTTRARIDSFYGKEVAEALIAGAETLDRWGFSEGKGALISKIYGTKIIPQVLKRFLEGELSAAESAEMITARVRALE